MTIYSGSGIDLWKRCDTCFKSFPIARYKLSAYKESPTCEICRAQAERDTIPVRVKSRSPRKPHARADYLRRTYNITPEDYDRLRVAQGYRCAICGVHEDDIVRSRRGRTRVDGTQCSDDPATRLHVDHCHTTGRVRGLLCGPCNRGIGLFKDNADALQAAARYLDA